MEKFTRIIQKVIQVIKLLIRFQIGMWFREQSLTGEINCSFITTCILSWF